MLFDEIQKQIPKYEKDMYLKGYSPTQILQSLHKTMIDEYKENEDDEITVKVEIKK